MEEVVGEVAHDFEACLHSHPLMPGEVVALTALCGIARV